jgi:hypothetical protein
MSTRNHIQGITNPKLFLSLFTHQSGREGVEVSKNAYLDSIINQDSPNSHIFNQQLT